MSEFLTVTGAVEVHPNLEPKVSLPIFQAPAPVNISISYSIPASGRDIMKVVAEEFEVSVSSLAGVSRARNYAWARQAAWYLTRKYTKLSFPMIARIYTRDHTTVVQGVSRARDKLLTPWHYEEFVSRLNEAERRIVDTWIGVLQ